MKFLIAIIACCTLSVFAETAEKQKRGLLGLEHGPILSAAPLLTKTYADAPVIHGPPVITKVFDAPPIPYITKGLAEPIISKTILPAAPIFSHAPLIAKAAPIYTAAPVISKYAHAAPIYTKTVLAGHAPLSLGYGSYGYGGYGGYGW